MAQLYLPAAHTDADLVLASQIAESIDSAELYVAWTPEHGHVVPEVVAELRMRPPTAGPSLIFQALRELWAAMRHKPAPARGARAGSGAARARSRCVTPRLEPLRPLRPPPRWTASPPSRRRRRRAGILALRRLGALARPRLVELDAPLAVLALLEREPRAERLARAALEAGHRPRRAARRDQLLRDRHRQRLAGLALPDHEAAARILARPAREALAVLDDVLAADRARAEVGPRDADLLELRVELGRPCRGRTRRCPS